MVLPNETSRGRGANGFLVAASAVEEAALSSRQLEPRRCPPNACPLGRVRIPQRLRCGASRAQLYRRGETSAPNRPAGRRSKRPLGLSMDGAAPPGASVGKLTQGGNRLAQPGSWCHGCAAKQKRLHGHESGDKTRAPKLSPALLGGVCERSAPAQTPTAPTLGVSAALRSYLCTPWGSLKDPAGALPNFGQRLTPWRRRARSAS